MKIVVDTNVLVSGLLSPWGPPGEIVRMISSGVLSLCLDARIFMEYSEVLRRPKFPFRNEEVEALLEQIKTIGQIVASVPLTRRLIDVGDEPFLEVAVAGAAETLVTGNIKHFPSGFRQVKIVSPGAYVAHYRKEKR